MQEQSLFWNPDEIIINASYQDSICDTTESSTIALVVNGGIQPYTYTWTDGSITDTLFNAAVGSHSVTITDNNGCMTNSTFAVDTFQKSRPIISNYSRWM